MAIAENPTAFIEGTTVSSLAAFVFSLIKFVLCCIDDSRVLVVGRTILLAMLWTWKEGTAVSQPDNKDKAARAKIGFDKLIEIIDRDFLC